MTFSGAATEDELINVIRIQVRDEKGEIAIEYRVDHPDFTGGVVKELSQNQIEELMKKEADPTYKIDNSVMGVN